MFSITKESTTESTTNETTTDDNTTEETTTEEYYYIHIELIHDRDYLIENGYAAIIEDEYIVTSVEKELISWGDISTENYYLGLVSTGDNEMSDIYLNLKCNQEVAEKILDIVKSKAIVSNANVGKGLIS